MTDKELAEEIERHGLQVFGKHALTKQDADQIIAALRQADLAQTEIKGHMRVEDDLEAEVIMLNGIIRVRGEALAKAQARIAELEKVIRESRMPHGLCHVMGSCTACTAQQALDRIAISLKSRA